MHTKQTISDDVSSKFVEEYKIDKRITVFDLYIDIQNDTFVVNGIIHDNTLKQQFLHFCSSFINKPLVDKIDLAFDKSQKTKTGLIRVSVANLHKKPSLDSPLVTQALMGTPVSIIKVMGEWMFVQCPDGYLGWISETVELITKETVKRWCSIPKVIVTLPYASVYSSVTMHERVSDVVAGNIVAIKSDCNSFYEVLYPDLRTGYIHKSAVCLYSEWIKSRKCSEDAITETAKQFNGIPYLWGGASAKAVDCSGFSQLVYFLNGIQLPRDADQQACIGQEIAIDPRMENILPGDLLFFGKKKPDSDDVPITHVGVSLGGKLFMQASGDVHFSSFDQDDPLFDKRRIKSLVKIRRIIGMGCLSGVSHVEDIFALL
jgi:gamma-D-glutamyl-L-lysine dipeptidyl-peptidase